MSNEPRSLSWINEKINTLYDFISKDLFDEEPISSKDVFLVLGGFIRAYAAAMETETEEILDEKIDPIFNVVDDELGDPVRVIYFLGSKLLNFGFMMNLLDEEGEDVQDESG